MVLEAERFIVINNFFSNLINEIFTINLFNKNFSQFIKIINEIDFEIDLLVKL